MRFCKDNGDHVSGCYGWTILDQMSPVIINKTTVRDTKKRKVRPNWVKHLPKVVCKWGFNEYGWVDSHLASWQNGSMDVTLFMLTVEF